MKPIRIILDTNVYIAAAINPECIIYRIVEDSAAHHLATYYTSPAILAELQDKLEDKLQFSRNQAVHWISQLERAVTVVRPQQKVAILSERDEDDNKILECALEVEADLIITSDADILSLKRFHMAQIMHISSVKFLFPQLAKHK